LSLQPDLWLDASDISTITESSGAVSQWNDKSGNGYNFTQSTGINQPTTGTQTINGLNAIDFDGSTDVMSAGDVLDLGTNSLTVFVVAKMDSTSASLGRTIIGKYKASPLSGSWIFLNEANLQRTAYSRLDNTNVVATSSSFADITNPFIQSAVLNRDAGSLIQRVNGIFNGSGTFTSDSATNQNNVTSVWLGALRNSADNGFLSYYFDGVICEIIVVLRYLTFNEVITTENYLRQKWGTR
jgi:hypothetical protein